jgi:hypothetical protein
LDAALDQRFEILSQRELIEKLRIRLSPQEEQLFSARFQWRDGKVSVGSQTKP